MHGWSRIIIPVLMTCLTLLSAAAHSNGTGATAVTLPVYSFTAPATEPVIEYSLRHHMLADHDPVPLLRVYGDGRLLVHRATYMKNAGDFVLQLQQGEVAELIRLLADKGILDFDATAAKQEQQQLRAERRAATGRVFYISDTTDTHIRIRLDKLQRTAASKSLTGFDKQITWRNLEMDARHFPSSVRLQNAAAAAGILHNLSSHPGLARLP